MIEKINVYIWDGELSKKEDYVCVEETYKLYINDEFIVDMVASPNDLEQLGAGYSVSGGYLSPKSIEEVKVDGKKIIVKATEGDKEECTLKKDNPKLSIKTIKKIMNIMPHLSETWKLTGGAHWAGLFDLNGNKIVFSEDIGRHNAVDKVIGYAVLNKIDLKNCILVSSGRQPYVMVKKAVNAKIPIIITKSPSTNRGVKLARENNIILIGFARGERFTIYSGVERIEFEQNPFGIL